MRWKQKILGRVVLSRKALSRELILVDGIPYGTPEAKENQKVPSKYNTATGTDAANKQPDT